jgi:hypothetical protein
MSQAFPSALIFLVYQREAGFLQGVTLRRGVPPLQENFDGIAAFLSFTSQGANPGWGLRRSSLGLIRGCSFFKAFRISLSL